MKKTYKRIIIVVICMLLTAMYCIGFIIYKNTKANVINKNVISTENIKKLTIKSKADFNKKIEYVFEDNVLKKTYIYEYFQTQEELEEKINIIDKINEISIIDINYKENGIITSKNNLGNDNGLSYEEIYNKYLVQIIGAYELVE